MRTSLKGSNESSNSTSTNSKTLHPCHFDHRLQGETTSKSDDIQSKETALTFWFLFGCNGQLFFLVLPTNDERRFFLILWFESERQAILVVAVRQVEMFRPTHPEPMM